MNSLKRRRPFAFITMLALLAVPAFAQSKAEEEAGDVSEADKDASGPLRERIRPVSGHLLLMNGRFELSPGLGLSIRDAFFTKYVLGLTASYHFTESLGVAARFGYAIDTISGASQICTVADKTSNPPVAAGCRSPTMDELTKEAATASLQNKAYGYLGVLASLEFQWSPIYGKLSLSAERFLSFNMYALAGPQLVIYGPRGELTAGATAGLGFRFFINQWLAVRTELRDLIYYEKGFPEPNDSVRNQLMVDFGFSMFFPTVFEEVRR